MDLTPDNRAHIAALTLEELLRRWRFAPVGDPWFQGETGSYWARRMTALRAASGEDAAHVRASKAIGWEQPL